MDNNYFYECKNCGARSIYPVWQSSFTKTCCNKREVERKEYKNMGGES